MTVLEVSERVWRAPRDRMLWTDVRSAVRSASGVKTNVIMTDDDVDACIDRAVEQCWPKCFKHEKWQTTAITARPEGITLPWAPSFLFNVWWRDLTSASDTGGSYVPFGLWDYDGDTWRWVGAEDRWLSSSNVLVTMEAIGKPHRRDSTDEDDIYCPVPIQQLLPLAHMEVAYQLAIRRPGSDAQNQFQLLENQRTQVRKNMTRMRLPSHYTRMRAPTGTTVVFDNFGQEDIDFGDLR